MSVFRRRQSAQVEPDHILDEQGKQSVKVTPEGWDNIANIVTDRADRTG